MAGTNGKIGFNEATTPDKYYGTFEVQENGSPVQLNKAVIVDSAGQEVDVAKEGTDATGVVMLSGGSGLKGWLSSIYKILTDRLPTLTNGKTPVTLGSDTVGMDIKSFGGTTVSAVGLRTRTREDYAAFDKLFCSWLNPTIGTAVALGSATQSTYAGLSPNLVLVAGTKPISLERLLLTVGAGGTGLTSLRISVRVSKTNKYLSGGTDLAPRTTLNQTAKTAGVLLKVGTVAIVAAADGSDTILVYNSIIKPAIPTTSDSISFDFGNDKITESNAGGKIAIKVPPVLIPAGGCVLINIWGPGQTAATTYEGMLFYTEE